HKNAALNTGRSLRHRWATAHFLRRQHIDELRLQLQQANTVIAEAKAEATEHKKKTKTLERFKEDNLDVFPAWKDSVRDSQQKASKDVALLRAAVRLATATATLVRAQNNDRQLHLQFTAAYKSDFNIWKKRKARDVWAEIVATKNKLDDLAEEYEDLAVEEDGGDDYVPESDTSESDLSMEDDGEDI
ncbi:hypothetical protein KC343_g6106, partial [Hortaea werneckii]